MKTKIIFSLCALALQIVAVSAQCPTKPGPGQHSIQAGENLYRIAKKYNISLGDVCTWNNLTVYDQLQVCQIIRVTNPIATAPAAPTTTPAAVPATAPVTYSTTNVKSVPKPVLSGTSAQRQNGGKHIVQAGETVASIAEMYGYTEWRFRQMNALSPDGTLNAGSEVLTSDCTCPPMWVDGSPAANATSSSATSPTTYSTPTNTTPTASSPKPEADAAVPQTAPAAGKPAQFTQLEWDMVAEINLMRSNPGGYVQFVEKFQRESMLPASPATAAELIAELRALPALSQLAPSACLHDAAKWHAETQRPKGDIDHQGVDNSWPWDRGRKYCPEMKDANENIVGGPSSVRSSVIVLLLDEGIANRGHRKTLLNKNWKHVACYGAGTVGTMPNCYVQMFGE
jgi:uncharacterized protein YkwD